MRTAITNADTQSEDEGASSNIVFNIPLSDPNCNQNTHVCTIRPLSISVPGSADDLALPPVFATATVDGYTQPGASPNTLPNGDNAVILIRIEGSLATTPGGTGFDLFEITRDDPRIQRRRLE